MDVLYACLGILFRLYIQISLRFCTNRLYEVYAETIIMFAAMFTWTKIHQMERYRESCIKFYRIIRKIVALLNKALYTYNFITNITLN